MSKLNDTLTTLAKEVAWSWQLPTKDNAHANLTSIAVAAQVIEDLIEETYKKAYIAGGIDAYNAQGKGIIPIDAGSARDEVETYKTQNDDNFWK